MANKIPRPYVDTVALSFWSRSFSPANRESRIYDVEKDSLSFY